MAVQEEFDCYVKFAYGTLDPKETRYIELRRAFFAGVWSEICEGQTESDPSRVAECKAFQAGVLSGKN